MTTDKLTAGAVPLAPSLDVERQTRKIFAYWSEVESQSETEVENKRRSKAVSDTETKSGYESAGNKSSPNRKPSNHRRHSYRDSLTGRRRYRKGKPGSRKNQRWLNDFFLGRKEELFDTGMVDPPEDWGEFFREIWRSPFSVLFEREDLRQLWEPFVQISDDQQEELLQLLFEELTMAYDSDDTDSEDEEDSGLCSGDQRTHKKKSTKKSSKTKKSSSKKHSKKSASHSAKSSFNPHESFKRIDRETRKMLRKYSDSDFLKELENEIALFLDDHHKENCTSRANCNEYFSTQIFLHGSTVSHTRKAQNRPCKKSKKSGKSSASSPTSAPAPAPVYTECSAFRPPEGEAQRPFLQMSMKDSLHRLLVHGVCRFYGLSSHSLDSTWGGRVVEVSCFVDEALPEMPSQSMVDYLQTSLLDAQYWGKPSRKKSHSSSSSHRHHSTSSTTAENEAEDEGGIYLSDYDDQLDDEDGELIIVKTTITFVDEPLPKRSKHSSSSSSSSHRKREREFDAESATVAERKKQKRKDRRERKEQKEQKRSKKNRSSTTSLSSSGTSLPPPPLFS